MEIRGSVSTIAIQRKDYEDNLRTVIIRQRKPGHACVVVGLQKRRQSSRWADAAGSAPHYSSTLFRKSIVGNPSRSVAS